ncbi:O-antigen ligase family protein [Rhizobium puerariae]|uniref:O-antigen ligase family protein n=1 Tax=Rhizobium puerariae TaxID=1585791 RepID=A0ABV6AI91_9HYPH
MSIALALLNYGAVDLISVSIVTIPIFSLLIVIFVVDGVPDHTRAMMGVGLAVLAVSIAWVALQAMPMPGGILAQASWRNVQGIAAGRLATISETPGDDWAALLRLALPFGVFLLGLLLFRDDRRAMAALKLLAISGGVISILSIGQFYLAPRTLLFGPKTGYLDSLTGFFVNRNTAATYFGLLALLTGAMAWRLVGETDFPRLFAAIERLRPLKPDERRHIRRLFWYGSSFLVSVIALVLTKSRAGVGASLAAMLVMAVLIALRPSRRASGSRRSGNGESWNIRRIIVSLAAISLVALFLLFLAGRVLLRAQVQGVNDTRFCVMPGIVRAVIDHLPWGAGLASFESVFPAYRDAACGIENVWDRAHNVYLEGMFSLGLAFPPLLVVVAAGLAWACIKGMRTRRRFRFAGEAGLSSLLLVALHSAFDFSMQISGLAIFFAAAMAPIVSICTGTPGRDLERRADIPDSAPFPQALNS